MSLNGTEIKQQEDTKEFFILGYSIDLPLNLEHGSTIKWLQAALSAAFSQIGGALDPLKGLECSLANNEIRVSRGDAMPITITGEGTQESPLVVSFNFFGQEQYLLSLLRLISTLYGEVLDQKAFVRLDSTTLSNLCFT